MQRVAFSSICGRHILRGRSVILRILIVLMATRKLSKVPLVAWTVPEGQTGPASPTGAMCGLQWHQLMEPSTAHGHPQSGRCSLSMGSALGLTAAWTSKELASGRAQLAPAWRPSSAGVAHGRTRSRFRRALDRGDRPWPVRPNTSTSSSVEDREGQLREHRHKESDRSVQEDSLAVQIAKFVLPACGLVAANQLMTAVDKGFVGRISSLQLAAMGSAATSFDCVSYVTTFINTGCLSLLGVALAMGDESEVNKVRSHALVFAGGLGSILGTLLILFAAPVCRVMGGAPPGAMLNAAMGYLILRALAAPIERLISVGTTFCLAAKDGATPLLVTALGAIANFFFDWFFCTQYPGHAAGAAAASSLAAALLSLIYLLCELRRSKRWPRPWVWPGRADLGPFVAFAGPVFLLLIVKSITFTQMTAYASGLGARIAAAHQIYVSLFFLTAVAVGTPLSWAAQTFMPGYFVTKDQEANAANRRDQGPRFCLRALLTVATSCAAFASIAVWLALGLGPSLFTTDPRVVAVLQAPSSTIPLIIFVSVYPIFLALEGTLIAARQLRLPLVLSSMLLGCNALMFHMLRGWGLLNLGTLWTTSATSLVLTTASSALVTARVCDKPGFTPS